MSHNATPTVTNTATTTRSSVPAAVQYMQAHVLQQHDSHRAHFGAGADSLGAGDEDGVRARAHNPPLFVAVQGPQGSGKTFLTSILKQQLSSPPHNLAVVVLSIDDLYLPHDGLKQVAESHPENRLLHGRGPPGTHDVPLGTEVLEGLRRINDVHAQPKPPPLILPRFDKSLFGGEGDRSAESIEVQGPVDMVLLEGWFLGFCPTSETLIRQRFNSPVPQDLEGLFDLRQFRLEDLLEINEYLKEYAAWWRYFDAFIQIKAPESTPYALIYKWRLEQEHYMKARNGGQGMSDDQVKRFIDRYIPGYIFFADGIEQGWADADTRSNIDSDTGAASDGSPSTSHMVPSWVGNGLAITIDENRDVVRVDRF